MKLNYQLSGGSIETISLAKTAIVIGRSSKCDLRIQDESISRHHCKIEVREGQVLITDLGSANGVYIDGKLIPANKPTPYPIFLSLSIGPHMSVNIESVDEASQINISTSSLSIATEAVGPKKTKEIDNKISPRKKNKDSGSAIAYIAAFVILAGGIWFFFQTREPKSAATTQEVAPLNEQSLQDNGNF